MATTEQVTELLNKMESGRQRLVAAVLALDELEAERVPSGAGGGEEWTVKEQLAHLAEMELAYTTWVRAAIAGDNPRLDDLAVPRSAFPVEVANEHQVIELLEVMADERRDTLALIAKIEPAGFERTAIHEMFGTLSVLQWLRSFYRHDRMHHAQMAGREPAYRPRFAGGVEPNQRATRREGDNLPAAGAS